MASASLPSRDSNGLDRLVAVADLCMDVSLVAVLFIAPIVLAGRHPWGKMTLMVAVLPGSFGMLIKVLAYRPLPISNFRLCLLALCLLIPAVQTMPWPVHWIKPLTPGLQQLFSEDPLLIPTDAVQETLSVSTATTRRALPMVVVYVCIFAFIVCRIDTYGAVQRVFALLMISAFYLTVIALLQANFGNGRFMWFYDHPSRLPEDIPRGPFQNENHFSSLLASTLPVMLFFLFRKPHDASLSTSSNRPHRSRKSISPLTKFLSFTSSTSIYRTIAAIACITVICTVFATPSRGGAMMIAFSACLWPAIVAWNWIGLKLLPATTAKKHTSEIASRLTQTHWLACGAFLCCALIAIAGLVLYQSIESWSYWRAKIWAVDFRMWRDFPLFGIGVGNHPNVYRAYLDEYVSLTFSTGESSWLQFLVETGVVGTSLAVLIVACVFISLLRSLASRKHINGQLITSAVLAGLIATCTHAFIDFPWHIPACFVVVLVLVAIADRLPHLHHDGFHSTHSRDHTPSQSDYHSVINAPSNTQLSLGVATLLMIGNLWAIYHTLPSARAAQYWDDYRRLVRDQSDSESEIGEAGNEEVNALGSDAEVALLKETLRCDPYHSLARVKLLHYLTAELEKRRVALENTESLAKLILAQSRITARLCPTESRTYLYAATALAALDAPIEKQQQLLRQSQRLRLVDGRVALRLGFNALLIQDQETIQKQFKIALNDDPSYIKHVVSMLMVIYPCDEILRRWSPSRDTAAEMFLQSRSSGNDSQLKVIGEYYSKRLMEDAESEQELSLIDHLLDSALTVAKQIGNTNLQFEILTKRLELQPRNVTLILDRASLLIALNNCEGALVDLESARKIAPRDSRVRQIAYLIDQSMRPTLR